MGYPNEEKRQRKIEEQIGKVYGYYTVLSFAEIRRHEMFFNCRCICGNEKIVKLNYLKSGHTVSCGCMRGKHLPRKEKDDLTGMKFGLWTVLHRDEEATTAAPRYICRCECGTEKSVDKYALKSGTSWHCGCQKEQVTKKAAQKYKKKFHDGEYNKKPIDLIGNKYGKLTVLAKVGDKAASKSEYVCQCDCGNKVVVLYNSLVGEKGRKSCGCSGFTDLTGQRFGKLVAEKWFMSRDLDGKTYPQETVDNNGNSDIHFADNWSRNHRVWRCRCDCGNTAFVPAVNLMNGTTQSCGCMLAKPREDLTGKRYGRLVVKGWLPNSVKGKGFIWECQCDCGNMYYSVSSWLKRGQSVSCGCYSRDVAAYAAKVAYTQMGAVDGTNIKSLQAALDGKVTKVNTSGIRGVHLNKRNGKWRATIGFKQKSYYLGEYTKIDDAAKVRKKAEQVFYGEFLDYYESELKEDYEAEMNELREKYMEELRSYAEKAKNGVDQK